MLFEASCGERFVKVFEACLKLKMYPETYGKIVKAI